ncbi:MAG: hypothetical protein IKF54_00630 [Eubacterium sp.]|nr:hypothetical protein [Eubacterium sp.]
MRESKTKKSHVVPVLLLIAALWLAAGTFGIFKVRDYMDKNGIRGNMITYESDEDAGEEAEVQPEAETEDAADPDEDEDDDETADEDDQDEEDDDDDGDQVVMVVSAPDGFAAVRTGRGVQFEEVGRINNGHKAYLTDLQNGWYKIAKGKYKGYYTHQSSFTAG